MSIGCSWSQTGFHLTVMVRWVLGGWFRGSIERLSARAGPPWGPTKANKLLLLTDGMHEQCRQIFLLRVMTTGLLGLALPLALGEGVKHAPLKSGR